MLMKEREKWVHERERDKWVHEGWDGGENVC